jgi:hypothetical protein
VNKLLRRKARRTYAVAGASRAGEWIAASAALSILKQFDLIENAQFLLRFAGPVVRSVKRGRVPQFFFLLDQSKPKYKKTSFKSQENEPWELKDL